MNRLSNYFQSIKLAKMHLSSATDFEAKANTPGTAHHLMKAMEYMMTANNNLASIAFQSKPRRQSRERR